ncbi:PPC domain-containing DNA-binding protein [Thermovenabulum sp.]|uniref:PPC domain-containing DNA-binding protein n=1 Tax=Thermovenabulum sp. TaxID=3100335 RepID=UPI003C7BB944
MNEYKAGREFVGRLDYESDLLLSLTDFVREKGITAGTVKVIGACKKAKVAYYNQGEKKYYNLEFDKPMEIISCSGNISLLNGQPMLHLHIALSDEEGNVVGGHLVEGTEVFAGEFYIRELIGPELQRKKDEITGLNLWC